MRYEGHLSLKMLKIESKFRKWKEEIEKTFFVSDIIGSEKVGINCLC